MPTLKDIAQLAGVSITTVSKVINNKTFDISDKTVEKVEKIIKAENYVPNLLARSMRTKKTNTIGLIIPDIRNPFFTDIARGVEDEGYKSGYNIFFSNSDDDFKKEVNLLKSMVEKQVDGILIAPSNERDTKIESKMKVNVPMVIIDRPAKYPHIISSVTTENTDGAYKAVEYLINQGHNKILHIAGPANNEVSISRLNGYVKAFKDNNLTFNKEDIIFGEFSTESGFSRTMKFDRLEDYTAIFCSNDIIAFGALSALNEKGISVPDQISLMGVDDIEYAKLVYPSLSTIDQSAYELGKVSAREMVKHLNGEKISKTKRLKQHLVIRDSVKNLNK